MGPVELLVENTEFSVLGYLLLFWYAVLPSGIGGAVEICSLDCSLTFLFKRSFWFSGVAIFLLITLRGALCTVMCDCTFPFTCAHVVETWWAISSLFSLFVFTLLLLFSFTLLLHLLGIKFTVNFVLYGNVWYLGSDFDTVNSFRISPSSCFVGYRFDILFVISWDSCLLSSWSLSFLIWWFCWYTDGYAEF